MHLYLKIKKNITTSVSFESLNNLNSAKMFSKLMFVLLEFRIIFLKNTAKCGASFDDLLCCPMIKANGIGLTLNKSKICNFYENTSQGIEVYYSSQGKY